MSKTIEYLQSLNKKEIRFFDTYVRGHAFSLDQFKDIIKVYNELGTNYAKRYLDALYTVEYANKKVLSKEEN